MSKDTTEDPRTHVASIIHGASMSPAPCRMICVEVFRHDDGTLEGSYRRVLGFLTVTRTSYAATAKVSPRVGVSHEEMLEAGWRADTFADPGYDLIPVVIGGGLSADDGLVEVLDGVMDCSNMVDRLLVPCDWPPEDDRENAIRIAKEAAVKPRKGTGDWFDLEPETPPQT